MTYIRKTVDIQISDEIVKILSNFKDNSRVAKLLLSKRLPKELLVDDYVDYISVSKEDKSKISYLTQDRITKMIEFDEPLWTSPKRYHCKPGAFVQKILKDISNKEILEFSNHFRSFSQENDFEFQIVSGNEIQRYYHYDSYQNGEGTLGSSCMRYSKCLRFFNIYSENKQISMLVMKDSDGMLIGRALLWNLSDIQIMDRIYTTNDEKYVIHFKKWATENGYLYKTQQSFNNTISFENGKHPQSELALEIELDNVIFDYYPYLDTFKWIDFKEKKLYNYLPSHFVESERFRLLMDSNGRFLNCTYLQFDSVDRLYKSNDCLFYFSENLKAEYKYVNFDDIKGHHVLNPFGLQRVSIFNANVSDRTCKLFPKFKVEGVEQKFTEELEVFFEPI